MNTPTTTTRINDLIASLATIKMDRIDSNYAFAPAKAAEYADDAEYYMDKAVRAFHRGRNRMAHHWLVRTIEMMFPEGAEVPHTFRLMLDIIRDGLDDGVNRPCPYYGRYRLGRVHPAPRAHGSSHCDTTMP
jgi:hypothetical protein